MFVLVVTLRAYTQKRSDRDSHHTNTCAGHTRGRNKMFVGSSKNGTRKKKSILLDAWQCPKQESGNPTPDDVYVCHKCAKRFPRTDLGSHSLMALVAGQDLAGFVLKGVLKMV